MRRWIAIPLSGIAALAAVALVSLATGQPAQLVQILTGSAVVSAGNPLAVDCVSGCAAGSTQDVNITEVGGNPVTTTVPVSGTVGVSGTVDVDVTATVGLTDAELRAVPVPVSGTVAATQSGSWTVTADAGTNLNTSALALETGGNLAAIANAIAGTLTVEGLGTAGTPAGGIMTVQGAGSMTPLLVDGSGSTQPISGTVTVTQGTAGNLNATVVGTGTFAVQATQSGSWSLAANQSVNMAQVGGVTTSVNNGTADTGTQRVTIASDQTVLPAVGADATGTTVPANAVYMATNVGGNTTGVVGCNSSVKIDTASSGNVELVALSGSTVIRVCGYNFIANGTVAVQMIYGTGTACATGETDLTGAYNLTAQSGIVVQSPFWTGMATAPGNALCIELSGAIQVSGVVFYTQY